MKKFRKLIKKTAIALLVILACTIGAGVIDSPNIPVFKATVVKAAYVPYPGYYLSYRPTVYNPDVKPVQQGLIDWGLDPGPVDGYFGTNTDTAVRTFQSRYFLTVDGIVGPVTWDAIVNDIFP